MDPELVVMRPTLWSHGDLKIVSTAARLFQTLVFLQIQVCVFLNLLSDYRRALTSWKIHSPSLFWNAMVQTTEGESAPFCFVNGKKYDLPQGRAEATLLQFLRGSTRTQKMPSSEHNMEPNTYHNVSTKPFDVMLPRFTALRSKKTS